MSPSTQQLYPSYFEAIVATIREPFVVLNADLTVFLANHSFYQHFQVKPKETEGLLIYEIGNKQWDIAKLRHALEDIILENSHFENFVVEHSFNHLGTRIMSLNGRRIEPQSDVPPLILLAIEDITERQTQDRIKEAKIRHLEAEKLVYAATHDLKAPLISVKGFLRHIQRDLEAHRYDRAIDFLQEIDIATNEMEVLIADLLEFGQSGHVIKPLELISVKNVVQYLCAKTHAGEIKNRNIQIKIDDLPDIMMEKKRCRQLFNNLIINAIQHGSAGNEPYIHIGHTICKREVQFFVRDNGEGLRPGLHEQIFELFVKANDCRTGTGVGLSIVKRIVETYLGRVWIESKPPNGATFWCGFPIDIMSKDYLY